MDSTIYPRNKEFSFAALLCNQLNTINPPPFITVPNKRIGEDSNEISKNNASATLLHLNKLFLSVGNNIQKTAAKHLAKEVGLLSGFIERKGTQLRLEKALQLSNQILKVGLRWKSNEFHLQLDRFKQGGTQHFKDDSGYRLPSCQWAQWIIYLCLRECALLVKIKLECEIAAKFWLGLISSSHHWGDSLVATGILSRIWHLSAVIFKSILQETYPKLYKLVQNLKPNDAPNWPSDKFKVPQDLANWLKLDMNLQFENMNFGFISSPFKENHQTQSKAKSRKRKFETIEDKKGNSFLNAEEDLGEIIQLSTTPKIREETKLNNSSFKNQSNSWSMLFKNHKKLLKSSQGRKKLFKKVKKSTLLDTNEKIKLKLRNILRNILAINNDDDNLDKLNNMIIKFQEYTLRDKKIETLN